MPFVLDVMTYSPMNHVCYGVIVQLLHYLRDRAAALAISDESTSQELKIVCETYSEMSMLIAEVGTLQRPHAEGWKD